MRPSAGFRGFRRGRRPGCEPRGPWPAASRGPGRAAPFSSRFCALSKGSGAIFDSVGLPSRRPTASTPTTMLRMVPLPRADAQERKGGGASPPPCSDSETGEDAAGERRGLRRLAGLGAPRHFRVGFEIYQRVPAPFSILWDWQCVRLIGLRAVAGQRRGLRRLAGLGRPGHFRAGFEPYQSVAGLFPGVIFGRGGRAGRRPGGPAQWIACPQTAMRRADGPGPSGVRHDGRLTTGDRPRRPARVVRRAAPCPARSNSVICLKRPHLVHTVRARRLHVASFGR